MKLNEFWWGSFGIPMFQNFSRAPRKKIYQTFGGGKSARKNVISTNVKSYLGAVLVLNFKLEFSSQWIFNPFLIYLFLYTARKYLHCVNKYVSGKQYFANNSVTDKIDTKISWRVKIKVFYSEIRTLSQSWGIL